MQKKCVTYNYINKYTGYLGLDNNIFLLTTFLLSQGLCLANSISKGSASGLMKVVQMCQQPWLHPQL